MGDSRGLIQTYKLLVEAHLFVLKEILKNVEDCLTF